jgi:fructosamine-3-kinase
MTRLFGGFGKALYEAYSEHFPKVGGESERNDIYQLYYLLVHLNLFGGSYKASVKNILGRYF